jgi:hypothetical protein
LLSKSDLRELFENMVTVDFQNDFCSEMHQDFVFFHCFKIIFDISTSKRSKNIKKLCLSKKIKFLQTLFETQFQTTSKYLFSLHMIKGVFESVITVDFQSVFRSKMHQNNIFYF